MRSLLLASAAVFMSVGVAMAQSSPSPAPTSSPMAPVGTTAPNASPGQLAQAPKANDNTMAPAAPATTDSGSMSSATPAPEGAPGATAVAPPGAAPGKMAPNTTASAGTPDMSPTPPMKTAETAPMSRPMHHMMAMPADGSPGTYLHIAKMAIMHHDKATADDALSHAETRLLSRAVPADEASASDASPAVTSIEHARMALSSGNMTEASSDTSMAMGQLHHGMMGGMAGPMGADSMSSDSMSNATANGSTNVQGVPGNGALGGPTGGPGTFGGPTIMPSNK